MVTRQIHVTKKAKIKSIIWGLFMLCLGAGGEPMLCHHQCLVVYIVYLLITDSF